MPAPGLPEDEVAWRRRLGGVVCASQRWFGFALLAAAFFAGEPALGALLHEPGVSPISRSALGSVRGGSPRGRLESRRCGDLVPRIIGAELAVLAGLAVAESGRRSDEAERLQSTDPRPGAVATPLGGVPVPSVPSVPAELGVSGTGSRTWIVLESTLVEIRGGRGRPGEIETLLKSETQAGGSGAGDGGQERLPPVTALFSDPTFRDLVRRLDEPPTNGVFELRGDGMDWGGRSASNAANIRLTAVVGPAMSGVLTDEPCRRLLRAFEQRRGVEVSSLPRISALAGQRTQLRFEAPLAVRAGINPEALVQPGIWGRTNIPTYTMAQVPVGTSFGFQAKPSPDGGAVEVTVTSMVTAFVGYDPAPKAWKVRVWRNGVKQRIDPPLPRFRVQEMRAQAVVRAGETLVLATWPAQPSAEDDPGGSGSARGKREAARLEEEPRFVVLVTPMAVVVQ